MPIYEYQCQSCDHEFEALQKMSDPLLTECPSCHEQALRKKVSAAAFRLKGGGWYETDFKTGKKKNVVGDGGAKSNSETKSSGTESKGIDSKGTGGKTAAEGKGSSAKVNPSAN